MQSLFGIILHNVTKGDRNMKHRLLYCTLHSHINQPFYVFFTLLRLFMDFLSLLWHLLESLCEFMRILSPKLWEKKYGVNIMWKL